MKNKFLINSLIALTTLSLLAAVGAANASTAVPDFGYSVNLKYVTSDKTQNSWQGINYDALFADKLTDDSRIILDFRNWPDSSAQKFVTVYKPGETSMTTCRYTFDYVQQGTLTGIKIEPTSYSGENFYTCEVEGKELPGTTHIYSLDDTPTLVLKAVAKKPL